jgi:hypothetical protein
MSCLWCGEAIDDDDDGAAFLFLAKRDGKFSLTDDWLGRSPHLEGHQFYCHVRCFRASVPAQGQDVLTVAIDEPDAWEHEPD